MSDSFNKKKLVFAAKILSLFLSFVFLVLLEFASRVIIPFEYSIDEIFKIIHQDPELIWRQKPNLNVIFHEARVKTNSMGFRSREVEKQKQENLFRIICMGASPSFGWGVAQDKTYSALLENMLQTAVAAEKKIEVINAANIGYSSHQGLILLRNQVLELSPDIITVPYVINDVDKHRFYRSDGRKDSSLKPRSKITVWLENFFSKSNIYNWIRHLIIDARSAAGRHFSQTKGGKYPENRRVSPEEYKKNLLQFIQIAKEENIGLVFIIMPVNLPEAPPLTEEHQEMQTFHLDSAYTHIEKKEYDEAIKLIQQALNYNPHSSKGLYYMGLCYAHKNNPKKAETYFLKAKEAEMLECGKLGREYNELMKKIGAENNVLTVDTASAFNTIKDKDGIYLFLDPEGDTIHPNNKGHSIIADQLYEVLTEYKFK